MTGTDRDAKAPFNCARQRRPADVRLGLTPFVQVGPDRRGDVLAVAKAAIQQGRGLASAGLVFGLEFFDPGGGQLQSQFGAERRQFFTGLQPQQQLFQFGRFLMDGRGVIFFQGLSPVVVLISQFTTTQPRPQFQLCCF